MAIAAALRFMPACLRLAFAGGRRPPSPAICFGRIPCHIRAAGRIAPFSRFDRTAFMIRSRFKIQYKFAYCAIFSCSANLYPFPQAGLGTGSAAFRRWPLSARHHSRVEIATAEPIDITNATADADQPPVNSTPGTTAAATLPRRPNA